MNRIIRRLVAAGSVAIAAAAGAPAAAAIDDAAVRGARYLASTQTSTGAFGTPDARADGVAEVVVSLVAGGIGGSPIQRALGYLRTKGPAAASKPAYAARIAMGIVAGRGNPRSFGGVDYVARITPESNGAYDANLYGHAIAALGLLAAGSRVPAAAMQRIRDHQCPDGGYAYDPGCASAGNLQHALQSNVDTTSLVLCVLVAAGVPATDPARSDARAYLASAANADRGYGEYKAQATNANSTGLALSAIAALGESPSEPPWSAGGHDPAKALRALQEPSGAFPPNDYAAVQAVPGLAGVAYPLRPKAAGGSGSAAAAGSFGEAVSPPAPSSSPSAGVGLVASVSPSAPGDGSVSAAAPPGDDAPKPGPAERSGLLIAVAIAGCAGVAEALRRGRKRWAGSRGR